MTPAHRGEKSALAKSSATSPTSAKRCGAWGDVADADSRGGGGGDERRERLNVLMREMCGHRAAPARPAETRPET